MAEESLDNSEMLESSDDFGAAYESHGPAIYRFLFWRTQNKQLSEDLTSNVFEKAWRSRHSFHGGSIQAWLHRIARNTLIDHWRKQKELFVDNTDNLAEAVSDTNLSQALDSQLMVENLQKGLAKLPRDMRAVVNLRFIEGQSCKQVASSLNLTESNVRVLQYRALRKLRDYLT